MISLNQKRRYRIAGEIDEVSVFVSNNLVVGAEHHLDTLPFKKWLHGLVPRSKHPQLWIARLKGIRDWAPEELSSVVRENAAV